MKPLYDFLSDRLQGVEKLAILGAGSVLRGDDAAGVIIAEKLTEEFGIGHPRILICPGETAPENYSGKIKKFAPTHLLIIDAADLGQEPGSIADIDPNDVGGPTFCSHMLPLKVMIDYLKGETGVKVILLGIQYKCIDFDTPMTPEMRESVDELCEALKRIMEDI